jgi:hypothetical protein
MRRDRSSVPPTVLGLTRPTALAYVVLFFAAFVGYSAAWRDAPIIQGDSTQYLEVARDLADFRLDQLHDRAPGYPLLLRITGSQNGPTRALFHTSLLLHFASIWLLALVLQSADLRRAWLLLFGCVLLLPSFVEPAALVMTENLTQFMVVVGVCSLAFALSRRSRGLLAVSALAFAYGAITRPVYQALAPVLAGGLWVTAAFRTQIPLTRRFMAEAGVALVTASLLLIGGVSWVNYSRFGYFGISPLLGFHLSTKTILVVERLPDEYATVREILIRHREAEFAKRGSTHSASQTIWEARSDLAGATGLSTPALSSYLTRMNLTLIRRAPLEYLEDVARSAATYWFPAAGPVANKELTTIRWLERAIHVALVGFLFLHLMVLGGWLVFGLSMRLARPPASGLVRISATAQQVVPYALAGIVVFYTMVVTCLIDIGEPRQRRATDVLWVLMCVLAAKVWRQTVMAGQPRTASPAGS